MNIPSANTTLDAIAVASSRCVVVAPDDPPSLRADRVESYLAAMPKVAEHRVAVADLLNDAAQIGAYRRAVKVGVVADVVHERLVAGVVCFVVIPGAESGPIGGDDGLIGWVRSLYGPLVKRAEITPMTLDCAIGAVRARMFDALALDHATPESRTLIDQVRYFIPGSSVLAVGDFFTPDINASKSLIEAADDLVASFRWIGGANDG